MLLDQLVLELISLEPALRPRSAFEVMQRLATIARIRREEPLSVSMAYLVTPTLIARDEPLLKFSAYFAGTRRSHGLALLFTGASGSGRSRLLQSCALLATMRGACVLRANASAGSNDEFAVARALATQLMDTLRQHALLAARAADVFEILFEPIDPTLGAVGEPANDHRTLLKSLVRPAAGRALLLRALQDWFAEVSKQQVLVVVVDDAGRIDDPSMAFLAGLAELTEGHRIVVVASSVETRDTRASAGFEAFRAPFETHHLRSHRFGCFEHSIDDSVLLDGVSEVAGLRRFLSVPRLTSRNASSAATRFYSADHGQGDKCVLQYCAASLK